MSNKYQVFGALVELIIVLNLVSINQGATVAATTVTVSTDTTPAAAPAKLSVAIHYEALCPDSMYFIRRQLYYSLQDNNWWPYMELKLLPFGKADFYNNTELGVMEVYCQHGESECELNALHACVIEQQPDIKKAFELINCMLRSYSNQIDVCARRLGLDVEAAKLCKRSRSTAEILQPYGRETLALQLSFVPSIVIDNQFEPYEQSHIRYNFDTYFCRKYEEKFKVKLPNCA